MSDSRKSISLDIDFKNKVCSNQLLIMKWDENDMFSRLDYDV